MDFAKRIIDPYENNSGWSSCLPSGRPVRSGEGMLAGMQPGFFFLRIRIACLRVARLRALTAINYKALSAKGADAPESKSIGLFVIRSRAIEKVPKLSTQTPLPLVPFHAFWKSIGLGNIPIRNCTIIEKIIKGVKKKNWIFVSHLINWNQEKGLIEEKKQIKKFLWEKNT